MMPADLERLHKYMLEIEGIDHISENAGGGWRKSTAWASACTRDGLARADARLAQPKC
jgi:hypothetical protein